MHVRLGVASLVVGLSLMSGCGSDMGPDRGEVQGTVTLDGVPLEGVAVFFHPKEGRPSQGETDSAGRYELRYTVDKRGALIGPHTVRISSAMDQGAAMMSDDRVPAEYNKRSELVREVEPGKNVFDFDLRSS